ncbi:MAG: hypothetical protein P4M13_09775 [Alphaproteobacteria bacterium]|nr:hypothetical protein [Alphaproteobacteria bacterium]
MSFRFNSLATLGDPPVNHLTSSYYVAEKRNLARQIFGFESFEAAVEAVRTGAADVALVAGAYPKIRAIIMDEGLICIDAFVEQIPPLVVCGLQSCRPTEVHTVYLHPATASLLPEINARFAQVIETRATSAAAVKAKGDQQSVAICNKLAADYYGLTIHQELRPSLNMPFALFRSMS